MRKFLTTVTIFYLLSFNLVWAQDPGARDSCYIVCGGNGYPGSGTAEICFQLRFKSDNTGADQIIQFLVPVLITGNNIVSIDTTVAKTSAGSAAQNWDIPPFPYKYDNSDPTVPPFHILYSAVDFIGDDAISGEGLLANICLTVNDTGIICIDTMSSEPNSHKLTFCTNMTICYVPGWSGSFCCPINLCQAITGDAVVNNTVNLTDLIYIVNYFAKGGPKPEPLCRGDLTADGKVTIADIVYLAKYIFVGGPPGKKSGVCCL